MPLCFFSMLFLLTPGSKAITACERVRKSRACAFLHHLFLPCHTAFISRPGNAAKDHHSRCIPDELPDDGFASQIFGKNKMMALRWRFLFENQSIETQRKKSLAEVWWVRRDQFTCHIVPVCSSTFPPTLTGSQHTRSLTFTWSTHMVPLNLPEHCLPCPAMRITTGTWSSSSSSPSPPDIPLLSHNPTTQARQPNTHPPTRGEYEALPEHFSPELKSLVARMLAVDPQQRLTLSEALKEDVARWDFGSDFWWKWDETLGTSAMNRYEP